MDDFMPISDKICIPYIMGTDYIHSQKFQLTRQVTYGPHAESAAKM